MTCGRVGVGCIGSPLEDSGDEGGRLQSNYLDSVGRGVPPSWRRRRWKRRNSATTRSAEGESSAWRATSGDNECHMACTSSLLATQLLVVAVVVDIRHPSGFALIILSR